MLEFRREEEKGSCTIAGLEKVGCKKKEFCESPQGSDFFLAHCNPCFPSVFD